MISILKNLLTLVVYINILACVKTTVIKDIEDDNEGNDLKKHINIHKKNKANIEATKKTNVSKKDIEDDNEGNDLKKHINIHKKNKIDTEATHMDLITFANVTTCKNSKCPDICFNRYNEKENFLLHKGLNTLVICNNKLCKFYDQIAYCPKGYGKFYLAETIDAQVCAYCKKEIDEEIARVIFYSCKYEIEGKKSKKEKGKKKKVYFKDIADKRPVTFDVSDSYRWISIIAKKL